MVSPISNFKSMNIYYDIFFNWQTEKKKLFWTNKKFVFFFLLLKQKKIGENIQWIVIGPVVHAAYKLFLERCNRSLIILRFYFLISIFQLGYHTLGSAYTPVAIWRDTRKWLESFMGNSQWETAPTYTWLSRSFRIFNESMLEQRCKRQANHGWDFDIN